MMACLQAKIGSAATTSSVASPRPVPALLPKSLPRTARSVSTSAAPQGKAPTDPAGQAPSGKAPAPGGVEYFAGLVTTPLSVDNGSSTNDMLKRNMQLAAGVTGLLGALIVGFMASNGLL